MKPLLSIVVAILVIAANAHAASEAAKELAKSKEPVSEAEESEPQDRSERCTACSGTLNLKSQNDVLAAIKSLPNAEVHTQESFQECSSEKGCAGIKLKDGKVVQKFGNLEAFKAAASADSGNEFQFQPAGVFDGAVPNGGPFWWMNQNSPFKNAGAGHSEKFSKFQSSSFTSSSNGAGDLAGNPFLNGDFSKLAGGFSGAGSNFAAGQGFEAASAGQGAGGAFGAGFGAGQGSGFAGSQSGFGAGSQSGFAGAQNGFGAQSGLAGGQAGLGGSQSSFNAFNSASKFASNGYTGSSPAPFASGSNVNLIQNSQKSDYDFEQQQQTQQNIDELFQSTGNVQAHENSGGELQQTCAGQGYICVHKAQCNNGVVNTNGGSLLQANTQKQYCNTRTEVCCRLETSSLAGAGGLQGNLGVGSATFSGSNQGSGLFSSQSGSNQNSYGASSGFGAGQASQSSGFNANRGTTASGFGSSSNQFSGSGSSQFGSSSFGNSNKFAGSSVNPGFGTTIAPARQPFGNSFNNEVFKSTSQSNFVETDSFSSGSENAGVYRPGVSGLKPGIPYLPPVDSSTSGSNAISSTAFVTSPRPFTTPRPISTPRPFSSPRPTYLPPVSSTSAPGYLPPIEPLDGSESRPEPQLPVYSDGELILDDFQPPRIPAPPVNNDIPAGCAAALKCTPIEFCTAEGIISNVSVILTREQDAYRVPLTDCKDIESGRIGKCCRDPYYTDPWPVNQLGKWVPDVFGGNDGKYVPDSRGSPNNPRPVVTARPPSTGGVILNNFRTTPKPILPQGPNQITPGFPSSTVAPGFVQKTQFNQNSFSQRGQGQFGQGGQGVTVVPGGQGQIGIGSQGQFGQGSSFSQVGTSFGQGQAGQGGAGSLGVVGIGQGVNQGQGSFGQAGRGQQGVIAQGGQSTQGAGFGLSQGGGILSQGQGFVAQDRGSAVNQGFGSGVSQGNGILAGQGFGIQRGQGSSISQGQGVGVSQGQGVGVLQGGGVGVSRGSGVGVQQGAGFGLSQGGGQGVQQGAGFGLSQGGGQGVSQGAGFGVSQGAGLGVQQGAGLGVSQGAGLGVQQGSGFRVSQGGGQGVQQGAGFGLSQGGGQGVQQGGGFGLSQGGGQGVQQSGGFGLSQGGGQGVQQSGGFGISQGGVQGVSQGAGFGVSQGGGQGVSQGAGFGVSQGQGVGVSQGQGFGVSGGRGQFGSQGQGQFGVQGQGSRVGGGIGISQGGGALVSRGQGSGLSQGSGFGISQGQGLGFGVGQGLVRLQGQGQALIEGKGEEVTQESVQRVFLSRYGGSGQCGILNPQKPYGNRQDLEVDFAEIPWQAMVLLQTNKSLLCGGVITRPDVVLTTASCVEGLLAKNVLIKGGEWKLGIDEEPLPYQIVQVKNILRHPFYKSGSLKYDAAVLVLSENLRLSKNIWPICLPSASDTLDAFYNGAGECIVTGWGKSVLQAHLLGSIMHGLNVSLINPGECQNKLQQDYPHLLDNYEKDSCVCGQPTNPANNICKVDTGSALACSTGDGHYVLRGIYSWESGCQVGNQLAAFYKFDLEWYEWSIGLIESVRFAQFTTTQITKNKIISQVSGSRYTSGIKGAISSGVKGGSVSGVKGFGIQGQSGAGLKQFGIEGQSGAAIKHFGLEGQSGAALKQFGLEGQSGIKGFGIEGQSQSGEFSQFGSTKFSGSGAKFSAESGENAGLNFGSEISGPLSKTFSATFTEKKFFQTEPKFVTYTTKPEIVTFTTKPEYYTFTTKPKIITYTTKPEIVTYTTKPEIITYTTKPKIVTYTTKPQIITYETSGSVTNPKYVSPSLSFSEVVGAKHTHSAQCKCLENGKK